MIRVLSEEQNQLKEIVPLIYRNTLSQHWTVHVSHVHGTNDDVFHFLVGIETGVRVIQYPKNRRDSGGVRDLVPFTRVINFLFCFNKYVSQLQIVR